MLTENIHVNPWSSVKDAVIWSLGNVVSVRVELIDSEIQLFFARRIGDWSSYMCSGLRMGLLPWPSLATG